ncbi:unnamed protein product [Rotaria socialis]|nr:unnamed protein product [Rotaria socialis]
MIACGGPCYFYQTAISTFDEFMDLVVPVAVSSFASLALLIRVIFHKHQVQQQHLWKKIDHWMRGASVTGEDLAGIQLLYNVILYNLVGLPMVIFSSIMLVSSVPQPFLVELSIYIILPCSIYVVVLLCPFVSLMSLSDIWPQRSRPIIPLLRTTQRRPTHTT